MFFHDEQACLCSLPATWTSVVPPEPFVELSAGRSLFRIEDLLALAALVRELTERNWTDVTDRNAGGEVESVKQIMPRV